MKSSLKVRNIDGTFIEKEVQRNFSLEGIEEQKNNFDFGFVQGDEKQISLNGLQIFFGDLNLIHTFELETKQDAPYLSIAFEMEGAGSNYVPNKNGGIPVVLDSGTYNFYYLPKVDGVIKFNKGRRKYFTLLFTEDFIKTIFKDSFDNVSSSLGQALMAKKPFLMFEQSKEIPFLFYEIIASIISCCYEEHIKEVYIKSKIVEILSYLFSEMKEEALGVKNKSLSNYDLNIVKKAEVFINENFSKQFTVDDLVKEIGTNKFKLKKDFKFIYKKSISSHTFSLRMNRAKLLLKEDDKTIAEVAYTVGYKNPQHFTAAFKRFFNFLPSEIKK